MLSKMRFRKVGFLGYAILASPMFSEAQIPAPKLPDAISEATVLSASIERSQDASVYTRVVQTTDPRGHFVTTTNRFTIIENCLNYQDELGQWRLSEDLIESSAEGAIACRGPNKATFSPSLNVPAVFDIKAPDGLRVRGGVRSLHVTDMATGKSVLVATVRGVLGELLPPNQIVYKDAFDGIDADLLLVWTHNFFRHDIILRSLPVLPEGFAAATTRFEVATEFLDAPKPELTRESVEQEGQPVFINNALIRFGSLNIITGKAFHIDDDGTAFNFDSAEPEVEASIVAKQWQVLADGRTFLLESIRWADLVSHFDEMPVTGATFASGTTNPPIASKRTFCDPVNAMSKAKSMQIAIGPYKPNGYAIDFTLLPDHGDTTFITGETYIIRRTYYIGASATFQPGCVIKFWGANSASLILYGTFSFPNGGSPCIFTSLDDDLYGGHYPGNPANPGPFVPASDGNPTDNRAPDNLRIWYVTSSSIVRNATFRWARNGIEFFNTGRAADHTISNCRFENIESSGFATALEVSIPPPRTVTFSNSQKCHVDRDHANPSEPVVGELSVDCRVSNATFASANQAEPGIAVRIDPSTGVKHIVVVSMNVDANGGSLGFMESISVDNGATWSTNAIATGSPMLKGVSDPSLAYDRYGNLFLTYNALPIGTGVIVALYVSTNNGLNFSRVTSFPFAGTGTDLPRLATGPSDPLSNDAAVWVSFYDGDTTGARVCGARITASGLDDTSWKNVALPKGGGCKLTGLAIGPKGEVMVSYVNTRGLATDSNPPRTIRSAFNSEGINSTNFIGKADFCVDWGYLPIEATGCFWEVIPIPSLAWDRINSKVYIAYHGQPSARSVPCTWPSSATCASDTDIFVRMASFSSGWNWGDPIKINTDASGRNQFFPKLSADDETGAIALAWYDCRDSASNNRAHLYGAVTRNEFWQAVDFQITTGSSDGSTSNTRGFWDYIGGTFYKGWFYPAWQDNSNSTGNNPDRAGSRFDVYIARIPY